MPTIALNWMTIRNFKSFREEILIEFGDKAGFKFLAGINEAEPRLGANGAGKSSLWDALCWCLYGASVAGEVASELASVGGEKRPIVEVMLMIDGQPHPVKRMGNPNLLELDEQPVAQAQLDALIGRSKGRFLQSVLFGQGVPFFFDLTVPQRGLLFDEILDLDLWMRCSDHAAKQAVVLAADEVAKDREVARLSGVVESLGDTSDLLAREADWDKQHTSRVDALLADLEAKEVARDLAQDRYTNKVLAKYSALACQPAKISRPTDYQSRINEINLDIGAMQQQIKARAKNRDFLNHQDICPTCGQDIDKAFVAKTLRQYDADDARDKKAMAAHAARLADTQQKMIEATAHYDDAMRQQQNAREIIAAERRLYQSAIDDHERALAEAEQLIENTDNPYTAQLKAQEDKLVAHKMALAMAEQVWSTAAALRKQAEYWKTAFKKVRLFQVKHALAMLELETANAANSLGLPGWQIKYSTEKETAAGTFKSGIFISVYAPGSAKPWGIWSGGEAQRIRLAVSLGIASMIQRRSGINWNFEIWDEPTNGLSEPGIEDLLTCLEHRARSTDKSVWLLDHRALQYSGFDELWLAHKTDKGTKVYLMAQQELQT